VDEAGRTTQPPLIMAPPSLKTDPDGEATDTIVDNGIMSSSRTRTGSSRSGASRRSGGANGNSSSAGDTATSVDSEDTAVSRDVADSVDSTEDPDEDMTQAGTGAEVPLPAETIGKAKGRSADSSASTGNNGHGSERQGSRQAMSSGDNSWRVSQQAETATEAESVDSEASADSVASAENGTADVKSERKPSFTASAAAPASAAASSAAATSTTSTPTAAPTRSGSSYPGTAYKSPAGYPASPSAPPASGTGTPSSSNGYPASNGFSSGAAAGAAAVGGAAAGLASSVTSAWQRRGSARSIQTRKSTKRQAMLTLARVEPWSVMKFSFVASVVAFIILFVAVAVLYMVLSALGVFDSLQHTVSSITSSQSSSGTNISHWFSASLILGYTAMLGALNIVLITAMSTVGSVIYNLIAKTIGGIEVTLRETD
jgi:Transmembrane domain of unknown function (DUF3566)